MSEPNKPTTAKGSQSKLANQRADKCSTLSVEDHRCPAPSPSPAPMANSTPAGTSAAPTARGPPAATPGPVQPGQSSTIPTRPAPLFTTRAPPKPRHTTFKAVKIHTAKCDVCNHHNTDILTRCIDCGWQICTPCLNDRAGDTSHTGGGPAALKALDSSASTRVHPRPRAAGPGSRVPNNPTASNAQGRTPNAANRGPTVPIAPRPSNILPVPTGTMRTPTSPAVRRPTVPFLLSPTCPPLPELESNPDLGNAEKSPEAKRQKGDVKGKARAHGSGNTLGSEGNAGPSLTDGVDVGNRRTKRPQVTYYPEPIPVEEDTTDKGKGKVVVVVDDDSDESDGGDIPYESWKQEPVRQNRVDGPLHFDKPGSMAHASTQTADQPLQTEPHPGTGAEMTMEMEDLLFAAAEALVDLKFARGHGANRAQSSNAAVTSSASSAVMHPPESNTQQVTAQTESTQSKELKRKRQVPAAQLRPARPQGYVLRTDDSDSGTHTNPSGEASTSRAQPNPTQASTSHSEPQPNEAYASNAEREFLVPMEIDENQLQQTLEEKPVERVSADGSTATTQPTASPRLRDSHRSALMVKDSNRKLKSIDGRGPGT